MFDLIHYSAKDTLSSVFQIQNYKQNFKIVTVMSMCGNLKSNPQCIYCHFSVKQFPSENLGHFQPTCIYFTAHLRNSLCINTYMLNN